MGMRVADRNCKSIRRIERFRKVGQLQQGANHLLDLWLFGASVAGHRALNFKGAVLKNGKIGFGCGKQRNAAGMAEFQRALNSVGVKNALECGCSGLKFVNYTRESAMDGSKTFAQRLAGFDADHTTVHQNTNGAIGIDDAVSGYAGAAVNAENPHIRQDYEKASAISDSSMSKLA